MLKRVRATFAYFTASVTGNQSASSVIVKAQELATITYSNGNEIKLENALPGSTSGAKSFTVKADQKGTASIKYSLKWVNISNTFNTGNNKDLVYTLTSNSSDDSTGVVAQVTEAPVPSSEAIIGSGTIKPGSTHNYTLEVKFKETGSDQTSLQGKTFSGKIEVTTGDESGSSVYYNASNSSGTTSKP